MKWIVIFFAYVAIWCFTLSTVMHVREIAADIKAIKNHIAQQAKP